MKRITILALLVALFTMGIQARGKQPIAFKNLPDVVKKEVEKNFTEDQIRFITSQRTMPRHYVYEFLLADDTKFKYDHKARLKEIKNKKGILEAMLPQDVIKYVKATCPNAIITKYEVENLSQKVELDDDMEMIFSKKGKFIRIDD